MSDKKTGTGRKGLTARVIAVIAGVEMIGGAVGIFKMVALGSDPYTVLNSGLSTLTGIQFGTFQLMMNIVLLVIVFALQRSFIGFGTIYNMVMCGYTADFVQWLLGILGISFSGWPIRLVMMVIAVIFVTFGCALYAAADMGISPYDAQGYIIENRTGGRFPFRVSRIVTDAVCVAIGFAAALPSGTQWAIVNIGTIFLTFGTGPLVTFFRTRWCDPLLAKYEGK